MRLLLLLIAARAARLHRDRLLVGVMDDNKATTKGAGLEYVEQHRARLEAAKAAPDDGTAARVIEEGTGNHVTDCASYWRKAILSQRARPSAEEYEWCVQPQHPKLVGFYGISAHEAGQRPATGALPDIIPAAVLARRASQPRRVFVPTDLDDHWIPDADPEGGIVVRKAVV